MQNLENCSTGLTFKPVSNLKKLKCKLYGHDFVLAHGKNGDLPMRVYVCNCCGKMSFKVKEHILETPVTTPEMKGYNLFTNMMFYSALAIVLRTLIMVVIDSGIYRFL